MVRWLFLSLGTFFLCSCIKPKITAPSGNPPLTFPSTDTTRTYLALGDSYTIGQSVGVQDRFPARVIAILKTGGISFKELVYIAQTGWTTANLEAAINTLNPPATYDIVSLLIGVNDQYQGLDTSGYVTRFTGLLQEAIQLAKGRPSRVFMLSIPDYSATPFVHAVDKPRVKAEIEAFNAINKRIALYYRVDYTDITPSSREAASNPALIAGDGLHPSGLEYQKWAALLAPKIKAALP